MSSAAGAPIELETVLNLRDIGGWPTTDGRRVRRGVCYRSTDLSKLDGDDRGTIAGFGLRRVYDLRTQPERDLLPDRLPDGATLVALDVLADHPGASAAKMADVLRDPAAVEAMLGGRKSEPLIQDAYRDFVSLPSAVTAYGRLFGGLLDIDERPALYHCTAGKDRTGWATAALLTLLGVAVDDVVAEYLLTNEQLLPALQPVLDRFAAAGGDPDLLRPVLGVRAEYLQAAFDEVGRAHGSIADYFAAGLGIDIEQQDALRAAFLEPA